MSKRDAKWFLFCGIGVGWFMGLSVSPTVGTLVSTVIGVLAGLAGALAGFQLESQSEKPRFPVHGSFAPIGFLVLGILFGSTFGIWARTHSWFSPNVDDVINRWSSPDRGLDRKMIATRLFDERYPPVGTLAVEKEEKDKSEVTGQIATVTPNSTTLFAASVHECEEFRTKHGEELRTAMQTSVTSSSVRDFASRVHDPAALSAAVEDFICPR